MNTTTKVITSDDGGLFRVNDDIPALLVAYSPLGTVTTDRIAVTGVCLAGRATECHLRLREEKISRHHFRLFTAEGDSWIEDLGSTNGTFVNGARLLRRESIADGAVIRAGQTVLVFLASAGRILKGVVANNYGIAGRFHAGPLIRTLEEATLSHRHILLQGPSGTGKELAAGVIAHRSAPRRAILGPQCGTIRQ
jgi:pSer/pThr/pTyr-binding forkhead associated (FHA) protein